MPGARSPSVLAKGKRIVAAFGRCTAWNFPGFGMCGRMNDSAGFVRIVAVLY